MTEFPIVLNFQNQKLEISRNSSVVTSDAEIVLSSFSLSSYEDGFVDLVN
jgi:hypothetical protein